MPDLRPDLRVREAPCREQRLLFFRFERAFNPTEPNHAQELPGLLRVCGRGRVHFRLRPGHRRGRRYDRRRTRRYRSDAPCVGSRRGESARQHGDAFSPRDTSWLRRRIIAGPHGRFLAHRQDRWSITSATRPGQTTPMYGGPCPRPRTLPASRGGSSVAHKVTREFADNLRTRRSPCRTGQTTSRKPRPTWTR